MGLETEPLATGPRVNEFDSDPEVLAFPSYRELAANFPTASAKIRVTKDAVSTDFLWENRGAKATIVFFHSAMSTEKVTSLPVFQGRELTSELNVNRLFVSEPALQKSAAIITGYFLGCKEHADFQSGLLEVLSAVSKRSKRLVIFGSSAGGYGALLYSAHLPGSVAVALNPQTDLSKHHAETLQTLCKYGWEIPGSEPDPLSLIPSTTEVVSLYQSLRKNQVFYMQNLGDKHHIRYHYQPFKDSCHPQNKVTYVMGNWGEGHVSPRHTVIRRTLKQAVSLAPFQEYFSVGTASLAALPIQVATRIRRLTRRLGFPRD